MHKFLTVLQINWLSLLGWALWLGAYSQNIGAEPMMQDYMWISPQVLYWIATIGAIVIGLMAVIQFLAKKFGWFGLSSVENELLEILKVIKDKLENDKK